MDRPSAASFEPPVGLKKSMLTTLLFARLSAPLWLGPCLTADGLEPAAGSGASAVFEATYAHCEGATAFRVVQLWIGDDVTSEAQRINLGYEAGTFSLEGGGTCAPQDPVVLQTPLGAFDCAASTVDFAGTQATVRWAIEFDTTAFAGAHGVYFDAKGGEGEPEPRLGWTQMGTFLVEPDASEGGGSTTGAGTTTASTSSGSDETTDTDTDTEGTSITEDGGIPAGGLGSQRGATSGCACTVHEEPSLWWLACLLLMRIRARSRT
jgi:hypothetical protein